MAYDEGRGRAVLFGGYTPAAHFNETWEWDGLAWTLATPAHAPAARSSHAMAYDPRRCVVVLFGGSTGPQGIRSDTWEWNGADWTQIATAHAPSPRTYAAMSARGVPADPSTHVVLFGGSGSGGNALGDTWLFDGVDWRAPALAVQPPPRSAAAMASNTRIGTAMLVGGGNGATVLGDCWNWDGVAWTQLTGGPNVAGHAMAFDASNFTFVVSGGRNAAGLLQDSWYGAQVAAGSVSWGSHSNYQAGLSTYVPPPSMYSASAFDSRRRVAIAFGGGALGTPLDALSELPSARTQWNVRTPPPALAQPTPRVHTAMTAGPGGTTVLYGGLDSVLGIAQSDTLVFDGSTWTSIAGAPIGPRYGQAMATVNGQPWLFGGAGQQVGSRFNDLWSWNGFSWSARPAISLPPTRSYAALAFDAWRQRLVLFGGENNGLQFGDTWELDIGAPSPAWQLATNGGPAPRHIHRLTYDQRRRVSVLFGGMGGGSTYLGDTWEYANGAWTQRAPAHSPPARWNHMQAYDSHRAVVVATGGYGDPQCPNGCASNLTDVWEYDGVDWRQRPGTSSPPPGRSGAAFAYDEAAARFVLQGGMGDNGALLQGTWLLSAKSDRFADGMVGGSAPIRCTQFPIAGRDTGFTFANPSHLGWLVLGLGPAMTPSLVADAPLACGARGFLFASAPALVPVADAMGAIAFGVPGNSIGYVITAQGLTLDPAASCFRTTDPLTLTIGAP